jgi:hypothetical protein
MSDQMAAVFFFEKVSAKQYRPLMFAIEDDKITRTMLQMALAKWQLNTGVVLKELLAEFDYNECRVTLLHSMFAQCNSAVLDWLYENIVVNNKKAYSAREPVTQATILHIVAERAPAAPTDKVYWTFQTKLFTQAGIDNLRLVDASGGTAMDHMAVLPQNSATYETVMTVYPMLSRKLNASTLRANKLSSELQRANHTNQVLSTQLEAAHDSLNLAQGEADRLRMLVTTEHIKIDGLLRQTGQARQRALELTKEEIMYAGLSDEAAAKIEQLTSERDEAKRDYQSARDQLLSLGDELQKARDQHASLALDLDSARAASSEKDLAVHKSEKARLELNQRIADLEREAETSGDAIGQRNEVYRKRMEDLRNELASVDDRCEKAEEERSRAMNVLRALESDLSSSEREAKEAQSRFDAAKLKNTELSNALRAAEEQRRKIEADLEKVQNDARLATLQKIDAENRAHAYEQQISEERRVLESELLSAKSNLEEAEHRALAEEAKARDALGRIEDAEERARVARAQAIESEKSQRELELLRASHADLREIHEKAEQASRSENQKLLESIQQMQKEVDAARTYSNAIEELRRDRDEKAEQLRIALQKHSESMALNNETRAQLELLQKESGLQTQALLSPGSSKPSTPRRPGQIVRRAGTIRNNLSCSSSGGTLKQKSDATVALDNHSLYNGEVNEEFFGSLAVCCSTGNHEKLAVLFGSDVSPNSRDPATGRSLLQIAVQLSSDTQKSLASNKPQMDTASLIALSERLSRTISLLIESGAEWIGIDKYLESGECHLSAMTRDMIQSRDDMSPFVRALLCNDPMRAQILIDRVQNLDRVPVLKNHDFQKLDYSFMHLGVLCASGRIVPSKRLFGRGEDTKAGKRNDTMVLILVQAGAPCDITDANECSPLHLALLESKHIPRQMFLNVVEYLLAGGADPDEICPYEKFIEKASNNAAKSPGSGLFSSKKSAGTVKQKSAAKSEFETKYNTPLKWAKERNEADLLNLLASRRYRRVTLKQLVETIEEGVRFSCRVRQTHVSGIAEAGDELDRLCLIYTGVFHWFNLRYESINNQNSVLMGLYYEINLTYSSLSGIVEKHPPEFYALLDQHLLFFEKLKKLVMNPEEDVMRGTPADALTAQQRTYLKALRLPKIAPAEANASAIWKVTETLIKCVEQVRKRFFEVSDLIRGPAMALYPEAALLVLEKMVREDLWCEMLDMLERADSLYGDLNVESIIQADRKFQCIDIAVQHGSVRCLEALMQRQRMRVSDLSIPGPCGTPLVSLAVRSGFAISLVAIDHFRYTNRMCADKNPNALHYGVTVEESDTTVLHQCALLGRVDLLEFCVDYVQQHIDSRTKNGSRFTPLQLAQTRLRNCKLTDESADAVADRLSLQKCVDLLISFGTTDQPSLAPLEKAPEPAASTKEESPKPAAETPRVLHSFDEEELVMLAPPPLSLPPPLNQPEVSISSSEESAENPKKSRRRKKKETTTGI